MITQKKNAELSKLGRGLEWTRHSIGTVNAQYKMKYKNIVRATKLWRDNDTTVKFMQKIKRDILDKLLKKRSYMIGKYNFIKNTVIVDDN